MRPVKRYGVNKRRAARSFRGHTRRTKMANIVQPMRGGWRL